VAIGEAQETWDGKSHWGEPGLYIENGHVYKIRVRWCPVNPPVPFSDIRSAGLGTAVGAFNEIPNAEVGEALYALCKFPAFRPTPSDKVTETNMSNTIPANQILYGPPGTGKAYTAVVTALEILDPAFLQANRDKRPWLKARLRFFPVRPTNHRSGAIRWRCRTRFLARCGPRVQCFECRMGPLFGWLRRGRTQCFY
jgi:hypothetical protein